MVFADGHPIVVAELFEHRPCHPTVVGHTPDRNNRLDEPSEEIKIEFKQRERRNHEQRKSPGRHEKGRVHPDGGWRA